MEEQRKAAGTPAKNVNVRELVWQILVEHELHGTYSNLLIKRTQDRYASLPLTQRSFLKRLAEGTIEREIELDAVIRSHQRDPEMKIKPRVRCLLRMSLYQIFYMDSVPDYAACSEAVRLCKRGKLAQAAGFVNGVLRGVCREKEAALREGKEYVPSLQPERKPVRTKPSSAVIVIAGQNRKERAELHGAAASGREGGGTSGRETEGYAGDAGLRNLEERYSMPSSILSLWKEQMGEEKLESLCRAMLEVRPVCIRLDPRLSGEEKGAVLDGIRAAGADVQPGKWAGDCYVLRHVPGLSELPGFAEGKWTVQDESSQLTAQAAGLSGRNRDLSGAVQVYDLCAAPGGKTMLAAALLPEGTVHSYDLTRAKTDKIRAGLGRMKLHNVIVEENDASNPRPDLAEKADLVLCDVPCSGLGVITRKRDIKYNVTPEKLRSLTTLQKKIVTNAAAVLKPGAVLIYSTCTINRQENEKMADFIEKKLGLIPEDLAPYLPENFPGICKNRVQLLPDVHGTDGFFMARFRKSR